MKNLQHTFRKITIGLFLFLITFLLLGNRTKAIIIILAFIAIAALSTFYYNYFHSPVNFELVKFSTILIAFSYGPLIGITSGIIATILSRIWGSRLDHRVLISSAGITMIALLAATLPIYDIRLLGILLVLAYHAITLPMSIASGDSPAFAIPYAATNMIFNSIVFFAAANPAAILMSS